MIWILEEHCIVCGHSDFLTLVAVCDFLCLCFWESVAICPYLPSLLTSVHERKAGLGCDGVYTFRDFLDW